MVGNICSSKGLGEESFSVLEKFIGSAIVTSGMKNWLKMSRQISTLICG
jgi:hypothetical protein